ncbi:MAG: T9SS type A sorting domain-containing protein [Ignavibacteriaceae bacterium]|nr:T9SS type A sorting domain-containing protein [Ignavibacteriaceae bacterium]
MKDRIIFRLFFCCAAVISFMTSPSILAQDFLMHAWYWDYPKDGCNGYTGSSWAVALNNKVSELKSAGFTYLWLPPLSRASFGNCSNGYDPKDLYDLGEYGLGATGFGTRSELNQLISSLNTNGMKAVADVVYNHRDGGAAENNSAVKQYVLNYQNPPKSPFPSDRYRITIDLGGSSPFGAGDYYFKISSKSGGYAGVGYKVYITTQLKQNGTFQGTVNESEPNGGCDCSGQCNTSDEIILNQDMLATLGDDGTGTCQTDEFHLNLTSADFTSAGDKLIIYLNNTSSTYSDHRIYGFYFDPEGPTGGSSYNPLTTTEFNYQTYTDFTNMPSAQGSMNFENFKPNSGNASTTFLNGDWDWPWFFYDYDQGVTDTKNKLFDWTEWLWTDVGIRGLRMDAVKHFPPSFVGDLLDHLHTNGIDPGLVVGEFYDGNSASLKGWVDAVYSSMDDASKAAILPRVFDFSLMQSLKDACDNSSYDVRNVFNSSIVDAQPGANGFNVVTFVGNHDFRDAGQYIQNDPILAYTYILTNNQVGLPCVFYPDYYNVSGFPNAGKSNIDALINVHKQYIHGAMAHEYLNRFFTNRDPYFFAGDASKLLVYQLMGLSTGKDVIVAINFDDVPINLWIGINTTGVLEGETFGDKIGNSLLQTLTVSGGRVNIQLPARSYAVWVEGESPVPVELVSFVGTVEKNNVLLNWKTATEVSNYGFEIERSQISKVQNQEWEKIGFVNGHGNSNSTKEYSFKDENLEPGIYSYRLKQMDNDGKYEYSNSVVVEIKKSTFEFILNQNYPNPFNPKTVISWQSPSDGRQFLKIYDILGNEVANLVDEFRAAGSYEYEFIPSANTPSGIYYYQLGVNNYIETRKMLYLK